MKHVHIFFAFLLIPLLLGVARNAQAQRWDWNSFGTAQQFRSFDMFLSEHSKTAKKLWEKPDRVNDPGFLNGNKELKQWLEDHPAAAREFHEEPAGFMERERHLQIYGRDLDAGPGRRSELARFDWFLDSHPNVRHDLVKKPELIDKPDYLNHHPDLRQFLSDYPAVRAELQQHPREFMERESQYEHGL